MKRLLVLLMAVLLSLLAAACAKQEIEEEPQFLEVELTANPEKAQLNEEVTFEAKVTYGTEEVKDADEVKFEIWRSKAEEHEKIVVEHDENGIYRLKKSFNEEGTYYIMSHVTARRMHNMPKIEFVVGSPSEPEEAGDSSEMDMDMNEHDTEANEEEGH
ncbi:FixH family protein [Mesobacillus subterraneus]|uniref:FixH family protein n=1 Tax=Mesobacillus subterraneus TaxID=285983 RepID=UPI001CFE759F|nr:FixH family protein [Mesobacillus subterraneus]WLR56755.1 FixH family protein [Mesobacillus subterraneus]